MHDLTVTFNLNNQTRQLRFQLDPALMTQKMMIDAFTGQSAYEPKATQLISQFLKPGDVFVDIGAHVGYFSMIAASIVGDEGRVLAFEPEIRNYHRILEHIRINQLRNIIPFPWAVDEVSGTVDLCICTGNDGGHALWDTDMAQITTPAKRTPVYGVSIDHFLQTFSLPKITVVKIDVEGCELRSLRGARQAIGKHRPLLVISECHRSYLQANGESEQTLRAFFRELGYETFADIGESKELIRLEDHQTVNSNYIFNLAFIRRDLIQPTPQ